jgi:hypothetical protein
MKIDLVLYFPTFFDSLLDSHNIVLLEQDITKHR